jgi:hypothetical protein
VIIRRLLRTTLVAAAALALVISGTTPASADGLYTPWSSLLPGWNDQFVPSSDNDCTAGRPSCLTASLKELSRIFSINGQACSHNAIFPMAYLRMTQTYGYTRDVDGYYRDVPYMNHMDAIFARYYTDAYYNWTNGDRADVPQVWLYAFDAGKNKTVTGAGDLFLGMNAHINRDLPFVLYGSGLVNSYGESGKGDYDIVEKWLNDDTAPLLAEAAQRFDPTIDDTSNPLVNYLTFQMVSTWRETAWRNAEALAAAPNAAARAVVAQGIENSANLVAKSFLTSFAVTPPVLGLQLGQSNATRDAYCAAHKNDTAPMAYPMGIPPAWDAKLN